MTRSEVIRLVLVGFGSGLVASAVTSLILDRRYETRLKHEIDVARDIPKPGLTLVPDLPAELPTEPITAEYAQKLLDLAYGAAPEAMERAILANLEAQDIVEAAEKQALLERFRQPKIQTLPEEGAATVEPEGIVKVSEYDMRTGPTYGDYDDVTYVWYAGDGMLVNEREEPVFAGELLIGPMDKLDFSNGEFTKYFINHDLSLNIELCYDPNSWAPDGDDEVTELRHDGSHKIRKFKPDRD